MACCNKKEADPDGLAKILAMDCEMVGTGRNGKYSILARVSIVNHFGKPLYNKYVKPRRKVTDYRTHISGIRPEDIENGENFTTVQKEVSNMLRGKILIGHGIRHDLNVLFLDNQKGLRFYDHPKENIRDTAMYNYKTFPLELGLKKGQQPRLKDLVLKILDESIQEGEHCSIQDAKATMQLYMKFRKEWENELLLVPDKKSSSKKNKKDTSEDPVAKLWKLFPPPNNPQFKIIPKCNFSIELYVQGKKFFGEGETKKDAKKVAAQKAVENLFGSNENCKNPLGKLYKPQYRTIPGHFSFELCFQGKTFLGIGMTKKDAKRMAAQKALETFNLESNEDDSGSQ